MKKYKIHLYNEDIKIEHNVDDTILQSSLAAGINHHHACGGRGRCSTCRVRILEGLQHCSERNSQELKISKQLNFPPEMRLACQTKIAGDISIKRTVVDSLDLEIVSKDLAEDGTIPLVKQQKLTIVFADIVNYSSFAESVPSYDVVHVLKRYYTTMNKAISAEDGFISNVAGDGLLAVFGLFRKHGHSNNCVKDAVTAILNMRSELEVFNKYMRENYCFEFGFRAGVHFGDVITGPFDTGYMKKIAVFGDNVNFASRIETANKDFGTDLLFSESAYNEIRDDYPNHNVYETGLKGKTGTYKLYELI